MEFVMHRFLFILGAIQILLALSIFSGAENVMHEIVAALMFGPGTVCLGLGGIIKEQKKSRLEARPHAGILTAPEVVDE